MRGTLSHAIYLRAGKKEAAYAKNETRCGLVEGRSGTDLLNATKAPVSVYV